MFVNKDKGKRMFYNFLSLHFLLNAFSMTVFTIEQFYFPNEEVLPDPVSSVQLHLDKEQLQLKPIFKTLKF